MNDIYQDLYYVASIQCAKEGKSDAWVWEEAYTKLVIQECINQMSDYVDKQRVMKHFGIKEE